MSPLPRLRLLAPLLLAVAACSSSSTTTTDTGDKFLVQGADMSGAAQNVRVRKNGTLTAGLTVTVNGTALTDAGGGSYNGFVNPTVAAGGAVSVQVTNGTVTATGTGTVPEKPVITGAAHTTMGAPVTITWTSATTPDSFSVALNYHLGDNSSAAVFTRLPGSARSVVLQTTDILAGGVVFSVGVDAYNHGLFSGAFATGSDMHLRNSSASFDLTIP
jgi:hypothetical protein